uniref:NMDA receptor synaptonuclear signaling and neuronal migration factor a n=1 Tax=Sinocyclocheilus rhinocerous TaxID=307959 RepID=A0A673INW4_9TELE
MLGTSRGSKENLELEVLKGTQEACQPSTSSNSSPTQHHHRHHGSGSGSGNHHHGNHHHSNPSGGGSSGTSGSTPHQHISGEGTSHHHHGEPHHQHHLSQPLQSSVSAHNIRGWGEGKECGLACEACAGAPSRSQGSLDLESSTREAGKQRRPPLERMCSVDRMTGLERGERGRATGERKRERGSGQGEGVGFSQQQGRRCVRCAVVCIFPALLCLSPLSCVSLLCSLPLWSGPCVYVVAGGSSHSGPRNWFPKENMFSFQTATTTMQANFRKHLRMVGSRRMKAQTFAERRAKSFNRSWSDPTPVKQDSLNDSKDSGDLQTTCGTPEEGGCEDMDWEEEREMERLACEGDDFIPPKIMLISSKVPKAEYVPNIIRRDDTSIIPILYCDYSSVFVLCAEEIEKRLTAYRRGSKIWRMMIFCQGGPGHLYLLKNKVATFAKVEKEEDMSQFWKRLSRFMSKVNPEPNLIHIMGCYVLGNPNGEKLFQKLKNLMRPYSVTFESPLELSAQGETVCNVLMLTLLHAKINTHKQTLPCMI